MNNNYTPYIRNNYNNNRNRLYEKLYTHMRIEGIMHKKKHKNTRFKNTKLQHSGSNVLPH